MHGNDKERDDNHRHESHRKIAAGHAIRNKMTVFHFFEILVDNKKTLGGPAKPSGRKDNTEEAKNQASAAGLSTIPVNILFLFFG
jgi:hypothetical protein